MPKIEDLERLGSLAFLMGKKKLPEELSKNDYDAFKSVFTNEYMESSKPAEDNDLPDLDEIEDLLSNEDDDKNENLENEDKITTDLNDLTLPDNLETENQDDKIISDINELELPNDLND